jgi:nucleotide-binding universal stress UspA family protein
METNRPLRLVVAIDGGPADAGALAWAAQLMERTPCEVSIVYLVSPEVEAVRFGVEEMWDGVHASGPLIEALNGSIDRKLLPFPSLASATRRFVIATEATVVQTVRELEALAPSFVVLGVSSRGRRAVKPASLLRALTVPAVCAREREAAVAKGIPSIRSVLVAVDLKEPAPTALSQAYGLLRHTGGRVELCYVRERAWNAYGTATLAPPLTAEECATCERDLRTLIPPEARSLGIETNVSVLEGPNAAEVIRQAAERLGTDVIALATHDRRGLDRAIRGSVTEGVLHASKTPALVIHT